MSDRSTAHAMVAMAMLFAFPFGLIGLLLLTDGVTMRGIGFLAVGAVLVCIFSVLATREWYDEELSRDSQSGEVRIVRRAPLREPVVLAAASASSIACRVHPVCVRVGGNHGLFWHGHVLAVQLQDRWFPLSCAETEERARRAMERAPPWLRSIQITAGEERRCHANLNISLRSLRHLIRTFFKRSG